VTFYLDHINLVSVTVGLGSLYTDSKLPPSSVLLTVLICGNKSIILSCTVLFKFVW
jgi:hypothetical protein